MCFVSLFSCMPWSMKMPDLGGGNRFTGFLTIFSRKFRNSVAFNAQSFAELNESFVNGTLQHTIIEGGHSQ